ncbi:UDP-galactopyranose mutase [Olleya sp. Bg11-27]|uniref:UDP-galactopyranose mutase n=1 Tax=Olleya sp. Bg11-27 TaxID=2058135 RepID=UPI000C31A1CB|nr:UDP-galactopyranose mutase [Olleya sp. Bg11-27]AUC77160.1 UDP-galactopyranose mutase [Olleya sp. Bg11-27]
MSTKEYDFLIVGSGLFGSVFAYEANKIGKKCLVIDSRKNLGGNVYCEKMEDITVHKYGPHIFHTNDKKIWDYVNQFVSFNNYIHTPVSNSNGNLYNLPFNMNTFKQLWGVESPEKAIEIINNQINEFGFKNPKNLEQQALSLVGKDLYLLLIKQFTEKQWGRKAENLPASIIKRLPVRFTFDNNYFNDKYQGIPIGGYNKLIEGLLKGIEVKTNCNFFDDRAYFETISDCIVFTGKIDEYYNFKYGKLEYRSLRFETELLDVKDFQSNAMVNYNDANIPYTRIIEHKHFEFGEQPTTIITKEFPEEWSTKKEAFYPINDEKNNSSYLKYKKLSKNSNVIFGGRLAEYKYYDMHQVIASALNKFKKKNAL